MILQESCLLFTVYLLNFNLIGAILNETNISDNETPENLPRLKSNEKCFGHCHNLVYWITDLLYINLVRRQIYIPNRQAVPTRRAGHHPPACAAEGEERGVQLLLRGRAHQLPVERSLQQETLSDRRVSDNPSP